MMLYRSLVLHNFPTYFFFFYFVSLLIYFPTYLLLGGDPFNFQAGCRKRQLNLALVFLCVFLCYSMFCCGCMFDFVLFWFGFSVLSKKIGWEELL